MLVVHSRAVNGRVTLFNLYGIIIITLNIDLLSQIISQHRLVDPHTRNYIRNFTNVSCITRHCNSFINAVYQ